MIPRVASKGYGFVGAGLYYLADKRPESSDQKGRPAPDDYMLEAKPEKLGGRVGFTETRNLPTRDPHKALRCMQWLAAHARDLRLAAAAAAARAAGISYQDYVRLHNPMRGQQGKKPVYTLSIAWHPTKNKAPTKSEMIAAGDEVLKKLGLEDRQCLMVSHTDTAHPHLHLIVNRVSPINGKYAKLGNDYLTLSAWALDYERRTGHILCFERMVNWEKRKGYREAKAEARKTNPKAKGRYVRGKDTPRADHAWWQKVKHLPDAEIRAARAKKQTSELKFFETKTAKGLVSLEARISRTLAVEHGTLSRELAARKAAEAARAVPRGGAVQTVMRRLAELVSPRRFRASRRIKALGKDIAALEARMGNMRADLRDRYAKEWVSLERRHHAERQRDELRIAGRARSEDGRGSITRARKAFNARGRTDTARFFARRPAPRALLQAFRKAARSKLGRRLEGRHALSRVLKSLGAAADAACDLRQQSLVRPQEDVNMPSERREAGLPRHEEARSDRQDKAQVRDAATDRETVIARELERLKEERELRQRRKRVRPRGRTRRME